MSHSAGDVFAARRELGDERSAEWAAYIEWRRRHREDALTLEYDEWLETIPANQLPDLIERVNRALEPDDPPETSSLSAVEAG